jgi:hypothetical protein
MFSRASEIQDTCDKEQPQAPPTLAPSDAWFGAASRAGVSSRREIISVRDGVLVVTPESYRVQILS